MSRRRLPTIALDAQLDLLRYYTNDELGHAYANLVVEAAIKQAEAAVMENGQPRMVGSLGWITHRTILGLGDTYAVTDDIVDVLQQAGPSMPTWIINEDDLPSRHGFVWLEHPVVCPDINGKALVIKAFGWQTASVQMEGDVDAPFKPTVIMLAWTDPNDPRDHANQDWEPDENGAPHGMGSPNNLLSMIAGIFPLGEDWPSRLDHENPDLSLGKFWLALLRFMGERWIGVDHERPDRHLGKRALRQLKQIPTIKVIHLRRSANSGGDTGTGNVEWSHRWLVSGHWRNQWYPSLNTHKPRWIAEYVKGPEGTPLIVHDKIFSVER